INATEAAFEDIQPLGLAYIFANFEPLEGSDIDQMYDYKSTSKEVKADVIVYSFVLTYKGEDANSDLITRFEVNKSSGLLTKIDAAQVEGEAVSEITLI